MKVMTKMKDLNAPHNTTVIVERGSEMAIANFDKGTWWIGNSNASLKERLDFTPTKWRHVER
jgi:hypothetical protein